MVVGIAATHDPAHTMFGLPRLKELLGSHPGGPTLVEYLRDELTGFTGPDWEQEDDITLVALSRYSAGA